jgi:hypothetical protein
MAMRALLDAGGVVLAALAVFLLGNPLSGLTSAPELLPQPWGAVGQFLPPGAGGTLLRSVAFFDGAGAAAAGWVLGAWAGAELDDPAPPPGRRPRRRTRGAAPEPGLTGPGTPVGRRYPSRLRRSASAGAGSRPARRRLSLSRNSICALTLRRSSAAQRSSASYRRRSIRSG